MVYGFRGLGFQGFGAFRGLRSHRVSLRGFVNYIGGIKRYRETFRA